MAGGESREGWEVGQSGGRIRDMAEANQIIITVSSNILKGCELCNFQTKLDGIEHFDEACKHLMNAHGSKCLHVGQQTENDSDGKPWHNTVAVFGL